MEILIPFYMFYGHCAILFITFGPTIINGCSSHSATENKTKRPKETVTVHLEDIGNGTKKDGSKRIFDDPKHGMIYKNGLLGNVFKF